jgi:prepilin-type N-terminal cleavage/methylation domain-containing protein
MNINQMKATIAKFRKADLSVIKDEKLRAQGQKLQGKEKGFTLLELLVVITLIAILATGALVAYEDIGEAAEAASAANAASTIDRAIRTYRAVENAYPNQWDNLLDSAGNEMTFVAAPTRSYLGAWNATSVTAAGSAVIDMFEETGIEELQQLNAAAVLDGRAPNRMHNESSGDAAEVEIEDGDLPASFAVVPNDNCQGTNAAAAIGTYPAAAFDTTPAVSNNLQNAYGDALEGDECHVVIALGFGGDAAASTTFSNVAIAQSPSYVRNTGDDDTSVNPETDYSRYIGLFQAGEYNLDDDVMEWNDKLRLIAVIAPDGKNIDQLNSEAQQ